MSKAIFSFLIAALFVLPSATIFSKNLETAASNSSPQMMILGTVEDKALADLKQNLEEEIHKFPQLFVDEAELHFQEKRTEWIQFFSKVLLEERLKVRLCEDVHCFFFPHPSTQPLSACALICREDTIPALQTALWELKQISLFGITEWELTQAKESVWNRIFESDDIYADKYAIVLQSISSKDIQRYVRPLFSDMHEQLDLRLFKDIPSDPDDKIQVQHCSSNAAHAPFYSLRLTGSDKRNIYEVMHRLAKTSVIKLGWQRKEMRKLGDKIECVHPLRFLSYVMGEGGMRGDMRRIRKSSFKWNNFMDGYGKRLSREAAQNNLNGFIPGFANSLGVNENDIQSIINRRDWQGLVNYFL